MASNKVQIFLQYEYYSARKRTAENEKQKIITRVYTYIQNIVYIIP